MAYLAHLGDYQTQVDDTLNDVHDESIINRIWEHDHTVWRPDPEEITNRLGWLDIAERMADDLGTITSLVEEVRSEGYTQVLLLGMGGSSLAPEVFSETFGTAEGYLELAVLDSTDPGAVLAYAEELDLSKTLFIVSSKSGGTAETLSFFKYFYNQMQSVDPDNVGAHFVAVTDPGSKLEKLGSELGFRRVFINDPNIGGRYSALSYFGLVPAGLLGVDLPRLLENAQQAMRGAAPSVSLDKNVAAQLGAAMGSMAENGRDKLTIIASEELSSFGDWVEQLIAESTGKAGTGILPVAHEPLGAPTVYGSDRLFVHLRLNGDEAYIDGLAALEAAGHPVIHITLDDIYEMGGQFFIWEMATAIAGWELDIQPFDQPNVEAAKVLARQMITAYAEEGKLPEDETAPLNAEMLERFLDEGEPGDYVTVQAFVQPTEATTAALAALRLAIRDRFNLATTVGYGPRYLHSTGQLHKGDAGNGLFIQFVSEMPKDADIPTEAGSDETDLTFGVLKNAQALGDAQALRDENRRLIRFNLGEDVVGGISGLAGALAS